MKLITLIPPQYRVLAWCIAFAIWSIVLIGVAGGVGWQMSAWRKDALCALDIAGKDKDLAEKDRQISELKAALAKQSSEVEILGKETEAARQAQLESQQRAAREAKASAARIAELKGQLLEGRSSTEIMQNYWEMSR